MLFDTKNNLIFVVLCLFVWPALGQTITAPAEITRSQQAQSEQAEMQLDRAAMAMRTGGSLLEAKARLDKVIGDEPENIFALKMRSQILIRLGLPADAHLDASKVTLLDPTDGVAWILYAETSILLNNLPVAYEALLKAATLVPERNLAILLQQSIVSKALGKSNEALDFAKEAYLLSSQQHEVVLNYIDVLVFVRRPAEAATVLARSIRNGILTAENQDVGKYLDILKNEPALLNRPGK